MQHVLIIHEVVAYPAWEVVFDKAAGIRKNAGEISYQLLRYDDDANTHRPLLGGILSRNKFANMVYSYIANLMAAPMLSPDRSLK